MAEIGFSNNPLYEDGAEDAPRDEAARADILRLSETNDDDVLETEHVELQNLEPNTLLADVADSETVAETPVASAPQDGPDEDRVERAPLSPGGPPPPVSPPASSTPPIPPPIPPPGPASPNPNENANSKETPESKCVCAFPGLSTAVPHVCGVSIDELRACCHQYLGSDRETCPTNVFGTFDLDGSVVPFIRVSDQDSADKVAEIIKVVYNEQPNVTGGATGFSLDSGRLSIVRKGLKKSIGHDGVWIVTGGTDTGIMKITGELVADQVALSRPVPAIAVATWGIVAGRKALEEKAMENLGEPIKMYEYTGAIDAGTTSNAALDRNHKFFILVDDNSDNKFGGETKFRAKLETALAKSDQIELPVVTVVVQGGPNTVQTAFDAVTNGTPLVVINGTGQAADLIADAWVFNHDTSVRAQDKSITKLKERIEHWYGVTWDNELKKILALDEEGRKAEKEKKMTQMLEWLLACVDDKLNCIVFSFDDSHTGLDEAILQAAVNAMKRKLDADHGKSKSDAKSKAEAIAAKILAQAVAWDRLGLAKKQITETKARIQEEKAGNGSDTKFMSEGLLLALRENKVEFVELLLQHGANPCELVSSNFLRMDRTKAPGRFKKGGKKIINAIVRFNKPTPLAPPPMPPKLNVAIQELYQCQGSGNCLDTEGYLANLARKFEGKKVDLYNFTHDNMVHILDQCGVAPLLMEKKYQAWKAGSEANTVKDDSGRNQLVCYAILIWAVCTNRFELARCFWRRSENQIPLALYCALVLRSLAHTQILSESHLVRDKEEMEKNAQLFEELAVGVLDVCYAANQNRTRELLHSKSTGLLTQPMDCMELALLGDCKLFLSDPATQSAVNIDWKSKPNKQAVFCPRTKFWFDLVVYFMIFLLHSYVTLEAFADSVQPYEIATAVWFGLLGIYEVHKLFTSGTLARLWKWDVTHAKNVSLFFLYYSGFGMILLYFSAFGVRCSRPDIFSYDVVAKCILAANSVLMMARFSWYYGYSESLGPKVIMISKMLVDLLEFACLWIILITGYGIAVEALLFPARSFDQYTVADVFQRPYFHIFGELLIDDLQEKADCVGDYFFASCGVKAGWFVAVLLALYLLLSNLLLINLLIAMFNQTYIEVMKESKQLWKKQNFVLLKEYEAHSFLPGPLAAFSVIFECCKPKEPKLPNIVSGTDKSGFNLQKFQKGHAEMYLEKEEYAAEHSTEHQVSEVLRQSSEHSRHMTQVHDDIVVLRNQCGLQNTMIEELRKLVESTQRSGLGTISAASTVGQQGCSAAAADAAPPPTVVQQEGHDDKQPVVPSTLASQQEKPANVSAQSDSASDREGLGSLPSAMDGSEAAVSSESIPVELSGPDVLPAEPRGDQPPPGGSSTPPVQASPDRRSTSMVVVEPVWHPSQDYPTDAKMDHGIKIKRLAIDVQLQLGSSYWSTAYLDLALVKDFTSATVRGQVWADPEKIDAKLRDELEFTREPKSIKQREIKFDAENRPMNPFGPTGIKGKGMLGCWGANLAADPIITRWKRSESGAIIEREGLKVLEVVLVLRLDDGKWAFPGCIVPVGQQEANVIKDKFMNKVLGNAEIKTSLRNRVEGILELAHNNLLADQEYSQDERNTDNAWIERKVYHFHDGSGRDMGELQFSPGAAVLKAEWKMVHCMRKLFAGHEELLKKVAEDLNAYWGDSRPGLPKKSSTNNLTQSVTPSHKSDRSPGAESVGSEVSIVGTSSLPGTPSETAPEGALAAVAARGRALNKIIEESAA